MDYRILFGEALLLLLLLLGPCLSYLIVGWKDRCRDILSGLSSKENEALKFYFDQFHPEFERNESNVIKRFLSFYNQEFGRFHFYVPLSLFLGIASVVLFQCVGWLGHDLSSPLKAADINYEIPILAVMGAYLWVVSDQITRWWYADLSPRDLYWACFRLAIAVPMGYSVSKVLTQDAGPAVAFFLGVFPTDSIFRLLRKIGRQKFNLGETPEGAESDLQKFHSIDTKTAERFASEGITTIAQLAYCDPIRLTIRTNLGYSYVVDCISQALLWIYTELDHEKWLKAGLRSSFEIMNLSEALEGTEQEKEEANELIRHLAGQLGTNDVAIRKIVREVAGDPYSEFLYLTWTSAS